MSKAKYSRQKRRTTGRLTAAWFTLIEWVDNKAQRVMEDWMEVDYDIDQHPDWWELPF